MYLNPSYVFDSVPLYQTIPYAPIPSNLIYNGNAQTPNWIYYDEKELTLSEVTPATNAGEYEAMFTPKPGYKWWDNSTEAKTVKWTIERAVISVVPTQSSSLTYTGGTLTPAWSNYDSKKLTIGGQQNGINAGSYTANFTPTSNYKWDDGSIGAKNASWSIGRASTPVPTQNGALTYTGATLTVKWNNYDANKMTVSGATTGINAASYIATFTPTANYMWPDNSTGAKNVTWTIGKAAGSLTLSPTSLTLDTGKSGVITATRAGNGSVSAVSSNPAAATVSVNGTAITVNGIAMGSANVTVSVAAGTNHNAPSNVVAPITVKLPSWTGSTTLGARVTWCGKQWIVVHVESDRVYLGYAVCEEYTGFVSSSTYAGSILQQKCVTFQNTISSHNDLAMALDTTVYDVTAKIFIATQAQANGGFSYFSSDTNRIFKNSGGTAQAWWLSTPDTIDIAYCVMTSGTIYRDYVGDTIGFRPFVALRR